MHKTPRKYDGVLAGSGSIRCGRGRIGAIFPLILSFLFSLQALVPLQAADDEIGARFIRGDANLDARVTLADVFAILRHISLGGQLACTSAADVDDSGSVNPTDAIALLGSIFYRHGAPPAPFAKPGPDPTPDATTCWRGLDLAPDAADDAPRGLGAGEVETPGTGCGDDEGGPDLELIHLRGQMLAAPGERFIRVPIFYTSAGSVEGLTISLYAASEWVRLERIDFAGSVLASQGLEPDWTYEHASMRNAGYLSTSMAVSLKPPFRTLPKLQNEVIAFVELSIHPETPVGSRLEVRFEDTPGERGLPPIRNEVSRKGLTQPRVLCGLAIDVVTPSGLFVRGDANNDRAVNLLDVVLVLRHLFAPGSAGVALACADAADFDDNGQVVVSDPIGLASYLFLRGPAPAYPFPQAGHDATPGDDLDCDRH